MSKRYGIWSIKTKGWVFHQARSTDCVFKTKRAAARVIKDDLVREQDYEVREYK